MGAEFPTLVSAGRARHTAHDEIFSACGCRSLDAESWDADSLLPQKRGPRKWVPAVGLVGISGQLNTFEANAPCAAETLVLQVDLREYTCIRESRLI